MKQFIFVLMVLVGFSTMASAQNGVFRISGNGCVTPSKIITINGDFQSRQQFGIVAVVVGNQAIPMNVRNWSARRVRVSLPRAPQLTAGESYRLIWMEESPQVTGAGNLLLGALGNIIICGEDQRTPDTPTVENEPERPTVGQPQVSTERAEADEMRGPNGQPEYVVSVTAGQAQAASNALQTQGATLLRTRNLPSLQRVLLVFVLPRGLSLQQAQAIVGAAANSATIGVHNIYGFAQGARLYAPAMIRDNPASPCSVRRNVRVGIIDGPVNPGHPALAGVSVTRFSALLNGEGRVSPDHGTAVAALIGGSLNAGPLAGFAPGVSIFAAEAFSSQRRGQGASLESIAISLDWLLGQNVRLINLSFSGDANGALGNVLNAAARRGAVMIAASGNNGQNVATYPAGAPEVIAVSAVDANGNLYRRSNRGNHIEFVAPGVDVYTAKGNGGGYQTGTSFAAPIVTGLAARIAARGSLSTDRLRNALRGNVMDLGPGGRDTNFGWGLVQSNGC